MNTTYQAPWWRSFGCKDKSSDAVRTAVTAWLRGAGVLVVVALLSRGFVDGVVRTVELDEAQAERFKHERFFVTHGSPVPADMARATMAVKSEIRPLIAAVAVVESNGQPKAVGDGGKSKGAWQVQGRHWGAVSSDAVAQALQAENIIMELVDAVEHRGLLRWRETLARYNGGISPPEVSYYYADRVLMLAWQNAIGGLL